MAFPEASKTEIRQLLTLVAQAFMLAPRHRLRLHPQDQLLALYRMHYPHRWMPDAMELEMLQADLQKHYGLDLQTCWHEQLTLGELLQAARQSSLVSSART